MAAIAGTTEGHPGRLARSRRLTVAVFLAVLAMVWVASLVLHEVGHALAAEALGGRVLWLRVRPGVEIWPSLGRMVEEPWGTTGIMAMGYATGESWAEHGWQSAVVSVMGSGFNLQLAVLALGALWLFRPRGWLRLLLVAEALMFVDLLTYCTLPEFFGLPHYLFYGGDVPEPLNGAVALGCPRWAFLLFVGLVSAAMLWGLVACARQGQTRGFPTGGGGQVL